jgi:N-acyl-phosphatidylethanolamine-hydrolysing phospholipase D
MPKEVLSSNIHELNWWEEKNLEVGEKTFTMTLVPAQHWGKRWIFDTNKSLWGGWVVQGTKQGSFWFAGDTGYCPVFKAIGLRFNGFSISAIPVGCSLSECRRL